MRRWALALILAIGLLGGALPLQRPLALHGVAEASSLRCEYCKRAIEGPYLKVDGQDYHSACFMDHVAPRCALCGKAIASSYFKDSWGHTFHSEHKATAQLCRFCGRVVAEKTTKGGYCCTGGKATCKICHDRAVTTLPRAKAILRNVRAKLATWGVVLKYGDIPLQLLDRQGLSAIQESVGTSSLRGDQILYAFTRQHERVYRDRSDKTVSVYALSGMPSELFTAVMGHELVHAWNFLEGNPKHSSALEEGGANYLSAVIAVVIGNAEAKHYLEELERNPDSEYGMGYRRARTVVEQLGWETLLQTLRTQHDFPYGY